MFRSVNPGCDGAPIVSGSEPGPARGNFLRRAGFLAAVVGLLATGSGAARAENRTLELHFSHTGENLKVVYKRNGRYDQAGMRQINHFLRDWRRNESTTMNPELIDLLWATQQHFGGKRIHIVSAYRSPATNAMLRSRSRGVAKHSQHTLGHATDFFIPGVSIGELRAWGVTRQVGGVGYYPSSGSPFVHYDVGSVRAWPRMPRSQLAKLFPDGKTLHLPADGKPLAGYAAAQQLEKQGKLARLDTGGGRGGGGGGTILAGLFGGGRSGGAGDRDSDRIQLASVQPTADSPARTRSAERPRAIEPDDAPVRVQTAAVETGTVRDDGDDERGLFRQLPSVSLGGLIDRFRDDEGDEEAASPEVVPVAPPSAPLTAVAQSGDPRGEPAPEQPPAVAGAARGTAAPAPVPVPAPRRPADVPAVPAGPVLVAALPPARPAVAIDAAPGTLAYATAEEPADPSPFTATVALVPRPPALEAGAIAAPAAETSPETAAMGEHPPPVIPTAFSPVRGASQQLIADASGVGGTGFSTLSPPDRAGAASGGILLAQGFLGAPSGFSPEPPALNTARFTGLTITVFATPRG